MIATERKKKDSQSLIRQRRPDRFHRSRRLKPITSRLDLQIRSGISILSALQIDNARGATRGPPAEEKTFMRPDDPAWLLTFSARTRSSKRSRCRIAKWSKAESFTFQLQNLLPKSDTRRGKFCLTHVMHSQTVLQLYMSF